jgi:hypothetical protein
MRPPAVGSVWVRRADTTFDADRSVPVMVLVVTETDVVLTDHSGGQRRPCYPIAHFRFLFEPAPEGTPTPVVWPPAAVPVEGTQITRLGDVPVGWLFRDGWEEPGEWTVRTDDDRSYEGALVECRPSRGVK